MKVDRNAPNLTTPTEQLKDIIVECIQDKKGEGITTIDLRHIPEAVCDYFVICHAIADTQVKGIGKHIMEEVKKKTGEFAFHSEGFNNLEWVLIDYVNVVVHIFKRDIRKYYDLEELWSDGVVKEYETL